MSIIRDKKSQKAFEFTSHAAISASAAAGKQLMAKLLGLLE